MRILLIILDGLADRVGKAKTPLEVAKKPNLDYLASRSMYGLMWPIKGIAPESGEAQFVLLGYPLSLYPGRGIIEALGAGIRIKKDCVYFRCNFAKFKGNKLLNTRQTIPDSFIKKINKIDPDIKVYKTKDYRGILEVKGVSNNISNTHPGYIRYKNYSRAVSGKMVKKRCRGKGSAKINRFIEKVESMLNITLLIRGASNKLPKLKKMPDWAFVGDMPVEYGLAKLAGMKILKREKNEIKQILKQKCNVYVQIKMPDRPGHEGNFKAKVEAIEKIDKMLKPLLKIKDAVVCITADHATPCSLKRHSSDPVPCLIYNPKNLLAGAKAFTEREFRRGFRLEGYQLMSLLKRLAK